MRLVHSYWSRPLGIMLHNVDARRLFVHIWLSALSVAYAKRIGAKIVLHTDTFGKSVLGYLPYDEILLTLDDIPDFVHPRFWAAGKIYAMSEESETSCHIDNDVFLKDFSLLEEIERYDLVVQEFENERFYPNYQAERPIFEMCPDSILKSADISLYKPDSVNCGVVRMNNREFKQRYVTGYKQLVEFISKRHSHYLDIENHRTLDLFAEQNRFKCIAEALNLEIHPLLGESTRFSDAKKKRYQHLQSSSKWLMIEKVKQTLEIINKDIYNKTYKLCRNI